MMKNSLLDYIPKTLQEDFIENRVVPFIGAGFSKNAVSSVGTSILDWNGLGRKIAEYIPNYEYTNALEALSLFEAEFSRTKLIEIIAKELKINSMRPGDVHQALCSLNFDTICTTNFDFLIEQALEDSRAPYSTITSEDRLAIDIKEKTKVVKLHGDFNNPSSMVITEDDYDCFLDRNKILSTYIANMFITKTLLLIGYSLDDYDIRTLWKIIGSRLGKLRSPMYVVLVGADMYEIAKFERRNVKVINLPGKKENYSAILKNFFDVIKGLIDHKMSSEMVITEEKAIEELKMSSDERSLCFISASNKRVSFLKSLLYSILADNRIAPITLDEVIMRDDIWTRKADLLINESFMSIIDITDNNEKAVWAYERLRLKGKDVILIKDRSIKDNMPINIAANECLEYSLINDNQLFIAHVKQAISEILISCGKDKRRTDYYRLLQKEEYEAAVIRVFSYLELTIAKKFDIDLPALMILRRLSANTEEDRENLQAAIGYARVRNRIVHSNEKIQKREAEAVVNCIDLLCKSIESGKIILT